MATVTGLTAARMLLIEGASIVGASISNYVLTLTRQNGTTINLGNIRGATGATGAKGDTGAPGLGNVQTVNGKTDTNPVLNAADVGAVPTTQVATSTVQGIIELATAAEVTTGTDTTRAVTPATIKNHIGVPFAQAGGLVAAAAIAAGASQITTVTFPAYFTYAPAGIVTPVGTGVSILATIDSINTSAMSVRRTNNDSVSRTFGVAWYANQYLAL